RAIRGREHPADVEDPVLERRHVDNEVPDQRKVIERTNRDNAGAQALQQRATRPALAAVDDHRAGAAHADPTGVAEGEGGIEPSLRVDERIQHRHSGFRGHPVFLDAFARPRGPAKHLQYHLSPHTSANRTTPSAIAAAKSRLCQRTGNPKSSRIARTPSNPWSSTSASRTA